MRWGGVEPIPIFFNKIDQPLSLPSPRAFPGVLLPVFGSCLGKKLITTEVVLTKLKLQKNESESLNWITTIIIPKVRMFLDVGTLLIKVRFFVLREFTQL